GAVPTRAATGGAFGRADATAAAPRFAGPAGVAPDRTGKLYVPDADNGTVRQVTPAGVVTTLAGTPGMFGSTDGTGAAARFDPPTDVAGDSAGNAYGPDPQNHTNRKRTPRALSTTLAAAPARPGVPHGPPS